MRIVYIPCRFTGSNNKFGGQYDLEIVKKQYNKDPGATPIEEELYNQLKHNSNIKDIHYNPKAKPGERLKIEGLWFPAFSKLNAFNQFNQSLPLNELKQYYKKLNVSSLAIEKMSGCMFNMKYLTDDDKYNILQLPKVVILDNYNKKTYLCGLFDQTTNKTKIIGLYQTDGVEPGLILGDLIREQLVFDIAYKEIVDRHTKTINEKSTLILSKLKEKKKEAYDKLSKINITQNNIYNLSSMLDLEEEKAKIFNIIELSNVENFK